MPTAQLVVRSVPDSARRGLAALAKALRCTQGQALGRLLVNPPGGVGGAHPGPVVARVPIRAVTPDTRLALAALALRLDVPQGLALAAALEAYVAGLPHGLRTVYEGVLAARGEP